MKDFDKDKPSHLLHLYMRSHIYLVFLSVDDVTLTVDSSF